VNTFILKTGEKVIVDRFVQGPKLSPGYWWTSVGDDKVYRETVAPYASDFLFGYRPEELLAKQYR